MSAGRERELGLARFVYVTRFGSHQCGGVLQLGGRRARGRGCPGLGAGCSQEEPRAAEAGAPGGGELSSVAELPPGAGPWAPAAAAAASASPQQRASRAQSGSRPAARADLTQKNIAKKYDFPIPLNEASKIIKKKKKEVSVWNRVYKVISRMLEENEKYRLRLNSQRLSSKNSTYMR
ncbi:uncharacterized protein C5orf47 homolog [Elephas maximus indicus]|uniref:uncharacterized protein C5orf47 homolog n=1 Tax=Elephas maximus indicus TaxID=99487 RepID=UPI002116DF7A|nr:uncharacterized protein C5orf47 homolog [Elephas maximus indicus]XP_049730304.1 uncharacterized protein C5orf47 homolog [Elephas maximus indicus]